MVEMSYDSRLIIMYTYSNGDSPIVCKFEHTRHERANDVSVRGTAIIQVKIISGRKEKKIVI